MPGEGSVYQRASDGRWAASISTGSRTSRRVVTVYRHTRAEALDELTELRKAHGRLDRKTTVAAFLERWLRDADVRPTTRHGYQAVIDTHLVPAIGHVRLAALSPLDVRSMMAGLSGSPKTRRNALVVLRRALREALRGELVRRNVASPEFVDAPKVRPTEPDALTPDEIARVLAAAESDLIGPHVIVALGTGLRQGEQLGLAWGDLRADGIHVERELARIAGKYRTVEPKTPTSVRVIPIGPTVRAALERQREAVKAAGFVPIETGPVFPNRDGRDLSGSWLTHAWYRLLERAGVRRRPWKILRATYGTRLRAKGLDELSIAPLMGHARTHTTRKHYLAAIAGDPTAAIESVLTVTPTVTERWPEVAEHG